MEEKGLQKFRLMAIKKTIEKTRELRPRLEDVFEDDVHLMVRLFNPLQKNRERERESPTDCRSRCLRCGDNVVPLRADGHRGGRAATCYIAIWMFKIRV